jgi:hypothetical protein
MSCWAKFVTARFLVLRNLAISNIFTDSSAWFDLQTGVVGTKGSAVTSSSIQAFPNGWYRCTMTATTLGVITNNSIDITQYDTDALGNHTTGRFSYVWGAQLEQASFPSTYIPTTAAAVTRNADVLTYPSAGNLTAASGTLYAEVITQWTVSPNALAIGSSSSAGGFLLGISASAASTTIVTRDGTNAVTKSGLLDMSTGVRKRAGSYGGTGISTTGDGASPATGAFDGAIDSTGIGIGCDPVGTTNLFGTIRNVRIYSTQLTDATLQSMTA